MVASQQCQAPGWDRLPVREASSPFVPREYPRFRRKDSLLLCKCCENCALSLVTGLSRYRTINKNSHVDESLFGNKSPLKSSASDNKASPGKAVKSPTSKLSPNTALLPIQADVVTIRRYAVLPCRANSMPSTTKLQPCANNMN